jgi:hypothetical protein
MNNKVTGAMQDISVLMGENQSDGFAMHSKAKSSAL